MKIWSFDLVAWRGFLFSALILNFIFACQLFFLQPLVSALGKDQIFMTIFVWFWFGVFDFYVSCKFGLLRFVWFLIVTVDLGIFNRFELRGKGICLHCRGFWFWAKSWMHIAVVYELVNPFVSNFYLGSVKIITLIVERN